MAKEKLNEHFPCHTYQTDRFVLERDTYEQIVSHTKLHTATNGKSSTLNVYLYALHLWTAVLADRVQVNFDSLGVPRFKYDRLLSSLHA